VRVAHCIAKLVAAQAVFGVSFNILAHSFGHLAEVGQGQLYLPHEIRVLALSSPSAHSRTPSINQESIMENSSEHEQHAPWNKGVIVGQKSPFKLKEIWAIRVKPSAPAPGS
jgi:hypothetical protein